MNSKHYYICTHVYTYMQIVCTYMCTHAHANEQTHSEIENYINKT